MEKVVAGVKSGQTELLSLFVSVFGIVSFILSSIVVFLVVLPIALVTHPFDKRKELVHKIVNWSAFHFFCAFPFWSLSMEGAENIPDDEPVILVANHQSVLDILLLSGLDARFRWVAKDAIFSTPILGWIASINGYICLKRKGLSGVRRALQQMNDCLTDGISLLVFPEGTRSTDGELLPFKKGAFHQAVASNVSVVPIVLDGSGAILAKGSLKVHAEGSVRLTVLPPVHPSECNNDAEQMCSYVQKLMAQTLHELRVDETYPPLRVYTTEEREHLYVDAA